jgi:hypothetical protein
MIPLVIAFMKPTMVFVRIHISTYINKKELKSTLISEGCDHDQSIPDYSFYEYEIVDKSQIKMTEYTEYVPTEFLDENGLFKEGKSFEDYDTQTHIAISFINILETGEITVSVEKWGDQD